MYCENYTCYYSIAQIMHLYCNVIVLSEIIKIRHHASCYDQGRGVAKHGGRDHEGSGDEIWEEPVEQNCLPFTQEKCKTVQGNVMAIVRITQLTGPVLQPLTLNVV